MANFIKYGDIFDAGDDGTSGSSGSSGRTGGIAVDYKLSGTTQSSSFTPANGDLFVHSSNMNDNVSSFDATLIDELTISGYDVFGSNVFEVIKLLDDADRSDYTALLRIVKKDNYNHFLILKLTSVISITATSGTENLHVNVTPIQVSTTTWADDDGVLLSQSL